MLVEGSVSDKTDTEMESEGEKQVQEKVKEGGPPAQKKIKDSSNSK